MLKIRRSFDRLNFNMGIPIPGKDGRYIQTGPCWCWNLTIPKELSQYSYSWQVFWRSHDVDSKWALNSTKKGTELNVLLNIEKW